MLLSDFFSIISSFHFLLERYFSKFQVILTLSPAITTRTSLYPSVTPSSRGWSAKNCSYHAVNTTLKEPIPPPHPNRFSQNTKSPKVIWHQPFMCLQVVFVLALPPHPFLCSKTHTSSRKWCFCKNDHVADILFRSAGHYLITSPPRIALKCWKCHIQWIGAVISSIQC